MSASTSEFPIGQPLRFQKRVGHAAADEHRVGHAHQVFHDFNLVGNFCAAQHRDEWPLGIRERLPQIGQFALHQQPCRGLLYEARDPHDGRMRAMGRTERVAHKQAVAQRRQLAREILVVGLFLRVVAHIFEEEHAAIRESAALGFGIRANAVRGKIHGHAKQFRKFRRHGLHAVFRIGLSLGPPQVRREDEPCAALAGKLNRRQSFADAGIVGNARAVERNVKIHAHEYAFPAHFQIANR